MAEERKNAMGEVKEGHDEWYSKEVDRGRRFHGAFEGGRVGQRVRL